MSETDTSTTVDVVSSSGLSMNHVLIMFSCLLATALIFFAVSTNRSEARKQRLQNLPRRHLPTHSSVIGKRSFAILADETEKMLASNEANMPAMPDNESLDERPWRGWAKPDPTHGGEKLNYYRTVCRMREVVEAGVVASNPHLRFRADESMRDYMQRVATQVPNARTKCLSFVDAYEAVRFGDGEPSRDEYHEVMNRLFWVLGEIQMR